MTGDSGWALPSIRSVGSTNAGCIVLQVLDVRVRPQGLSWPRETPETLPCVYCVLRLGGYHHRSATFPPEGLATVASRLTVSKQAFRQYSDHELQHGDEGIAADAASVRWVLPHSCLQQQKQQRLQNEDEAGGKPRLAGELGLEVFDDLMAYEEEGDCPLDGFMPVRLCVFSVPLAELQEQEGPRWWSSQSQDGSYAVEVLLSAALSIFAVTEPVAVDGEHSAGEQGDTAEGGYASERLRKRSAGVAFEYDQLGQRVEGPRNIARSTCFAMLTALRSNAQVAHWRFAAEAGLLPPPFRQHFPPPSAAGAAPAEVLEAPAAAAAATQSRGGATAFGSSAQSHSSSSSSSSQPEHFLTTSEAAAATVSAAAAAAVAAAAAAAADAQQRGWAPPPQRWSQSAATLRSLVWSSGVPAERRGELYEELSGGAALRRRAAAHCRGGSGDAYYWGLVHEFQELTGTAHSHYADLSREPPAEASAEASASATVRADSDSADGTADRRMEPQTDASSNVVGLPALTSVTSVAPADDSASVAQKLHAERANHAAAALPEDISVETSGGAHSASLEAEAETRSVSSPDASIAEAAEEQEDDAAAPCAGGSAERSSGEEPSRRGASSASASSSGASSTNSSIADFMSASGGDGSGGLFVALSGGEEGSAGERSGARSAAAQRARRSSFSPGNSSVASDYYDAVAWLSEDDERWLSDASDAAFVTPLAPPAAVLSNGGGEGGVRQRRAQRGGGAGGGGGAAPERSGSSSGGGSSGGGGAPQRDVAAVNFVATEIEKDVTRVFKGGCARVNTDEGRNALRRVLSASALRNPDVGYCQGMNFIAGLLLQVMSEESAFWTLSGLLEGPLRGYHSCSMARTRSEIAAVKALLEDEFASLSDAMQNVGLPLELMVVPWLMACFINSFPAPTALRCLEVIMLEGPTATFAIALAFVRMHEPVLLEAIDADTLMPVVNAAQAGMHDAQLLLDHAAWEMSDKGDKIEAVRQHHQRSEDPDGSAHGAEESAAAANNHHEHRANTLALLLGWAEASIVNAVPPLRLLTGGARGVAAGTLKTLRWLLGWQFLAPVRALGLGERAEEERSYGDARSKRKNA